MASENEKLLEKAKKCFKRASEAEARQRERELEDLRFQIPEYQWDEAARLARAGGLIGGQAVPPRPMLSISLIAQPLQLIKNQAANASLGVDIHPVSEEAEQELAEVKQGLYRRIERDSNADQARLWALDRATQCGRGWYRVNTQWDEDGDDPSDQEIVIERIWDQSCVYIDPAAQKPDCSDAEWGLVVAYVQVDTFKELYPKAEAPTNDQEFKAWLSDEPQWVMGDGRENAVLVAEYFYKVHDRKQVKVGKMTREMDEVTVKWCKLTAREILEGPQEGNGKYIPLIPVIGKELQPFDGERRVEGLVRPAQHGQKGFNYAISNLVEAMSVEPKVPWIGAEGQFEGHEHEWGQSNVRNFPYLEYKPVTIDGQQAPPPQRAQVDGGRMTLAMQAAGQFRELVQTATAVHEPSLGDLPQRRGEQSGRAILALQQQSDAGTGHFLQNLAKVSMAYEAKVILDLMPAIYDRPGRVTQILGAEDDAKAVMLGAPFVPGQDGRPMPAPQQPGMPPPAGMKNYDLTKGKYAISVQVGKSYQTRLQEGQSEIGEVLQAQPNLMLMIGATYFRFRDFPGAKEIADILKKVRDQQYPMLAEDENPESPEQLKAQLQQMQQGMQEHEQVIQQLQEALKTEQAKQQATVQKAQIDAQAGQQKAVIAAESDANVARIQQETEIALAQIKAELESLKTQVQAQTAMRSQMMGQAHEAGMAAGAPPDTTFRDSNELPLDQ